MLVISRRPGQSVVIQGGIKVTVVWCDRGTVRLGIDAPPEIRVDRAEIAAARERQAEERRRE